MFGTADAALGQSPGAAWQWHWHIAMFNVEVRYVYVTSDM